jgi:hypothetical protein
VHIQYLSTLNATAIDGFDASHARQVKVHQGDIGLMSAEGVDPWRMIG